MTTQEDKEQEKLELGIRALAAYIEYKLESLYGEEVEFVLNACSRSGKRIEFLANCNDWCAIDWMKKSLKNIEKIQ